MKLKRTQMSAAAYNTEKIKRVLDTDTDMIMLDLEDNVIPPLKNKAREVLVKVLQDWDFHGIIKCVKINGWETGMTLTDLEASVPYGIDEVKLSKAENADDVRRLDSALADIERKCNIPIGSTEINVQIESPQGVRNAYDILSASNRVTCASFGYEDISSALGIYRDYTPGTMQAIYLTGKLVVDANAAGIRQINATAIVAKPGEYQGEEDYVRKDTMRLKNMGFTSRGAIYNSHVKIINEVFTPDPQVVEESRIIISHWEEGIKTGNPDCFILDNGLPMDSGRVDRAKRIVAFGDAYRELLVRKGR